MFQQDIYRASDMKISLKAQVDTVAVINGKLSDCEELNKLFGF